MTGVAPTPSDETPSSSSEARREHAEVERLESRTMDQRRHTLLIVDDEPNLLDSLQRLFQRRYRVLTAASGEEALRLIDEHEVHLILSDQRMPGMSGGTLLAKIRERKPDIIRMLFTGFADIESVVNAVNHGHIFRFLLKPWQPGELEVVIEQAAMQYDLIADRKRLIHDLRTANEQLTRANRELSELNRLKTAFLEVASHEFNTPITLVQGMSELLRLINPERDEAEREIIATLSEGAQRLARLVADTLKLMSAEDFRIALRSRPVDLNGLLQEVVSQVSPFLHARNQHLRLEVPDPLGTFDLDADKIIDVVVNLLTNAIKFTPDGGEITLSARLVTPDEAEIVVADRGIGVEPRVLERFFEPFFTAFDSNHHSSGHFGFQKRGLGLGLSLVKKFLELHHGRVWATSTPGQGTQVMVRLPRQQVDDLSKP